MLQSVNSLNDLCIRLTMLLEEQDRPMLPDPLFLDHKERFTLREEVLKAAFRFPSLFSRLLYYSFELLIVNSPKDFLAHRTQLHLKTILCFQFFMQKKNGQGHSGKWNAKTFDPQAISGAFANLRKSRLLLFLHAH